MKWRLPLSFLIALAITPIFAQGHQDPSDAPSLQEPENHTLVVERLMEYHDYGEYDREIREVVNTARNYLDAVVRSAPKNDKLAAVFDIDETSLSNWDAMADCGFCAYSIQAKLYSNAHDPAIVPVLELYNFAKESGVALFFVTGRQEQERKLTIQNLNEVGYSKWTELFVQPDGNKLPARVFKPRDRQKITDEGYRIVLNIGDQATDLAGCCAERTFKLPNPFYLLK
jgi:predicted secreted acid phosphatase